MSLFAAMLYQTKPSMEGTVYRHSMLDEARVVSSISEPDPCTQDSKVRNMGRIIQSIKDGNDTTARVAKDLSMSKALVYGYLKVLEEEGLVKQFRPDTRKGTQGRISFVLEAV